MCWCKNIKITVFDLITIHSPKSAQSNNSVDYSKCTFCLLLYDAYVLVYSFVLQPLVNAIQMSTHNICFNKEIQYKIAYTSSNTQQTIYIGPIWDSVWVLYGYPIWGQYGFCNQRDLHVQVIAHAYNPDALTLSTLGKIFSRRHFEIFFLFFPENRI